MANSPNIFMYLMDIVSKAQINAAEKTGDESKIKAAKAKYENVKEDEVTFGTPKRNELTKKWEISISSQKRGFNLTKVSYNTGTLQGLIKNIVQGYAQLDTLTKVGRPTVAFVDENNSYYLVVEENANNYDAIQLTGYSFPAEALRTVIYPEKDVANQAVGFIDIDHSLITGRFLLNWLNRSGQADPQHGADLDVETEEEQEDDQQDLQQLQLHGTDKVAGESMQPPVEGSDETTYGEQTQQTEEGVDTEHKPVNQDSDQNGLSIPSSQAEPRYDNNGEGVQTPAENSALSVNHDEGQIPAGNGTDGQNAEGAQSGPDSQPTDEEVAENQPAQPVEGEAGDVQEPTSDEQNVATDNQQPATGDSQENPQGTETQPTDGTDGQQQSPDAADEAQKETSIEEATEENTAPEEEPNEDNTAPSADAGKKSKK